MKKKNASRSLPSILPARNASPSDAGGPIPLLSLNSQLSTLNFPRLLLSSALCLAGTLLALLAFALYPGATAMAQAQDQSIPKPPSPNLTNLPTTAGQLIISEFRVRGPNGANDEFIELYNATAGRLTTQSADGSPGLAVAASDGIARCVVPNNTQIPAGGHFLCTNSVAYSLGAYSTGDVTYTADIPDQAGIALFNNSTGGASFSQANRLDAAGPVAEANALYREGAGLGTLTPFSIDYAWVRRWPGGCLLACTGVPGPTGTQPQDTDNNAADFFFADTNGTQAGGGQRLAAPGPQNLAAAVATDGDPNVTLLDPCGAENASPNLVLDPTTDPGNNSTFGTYSIRRTFINNTASAITRLRFRIVDINTFPAPDTFADLRARTSPNVAATVDRPPCGTGTSSVTVQGTTLEQAPSQPNGGGMNSTLSVGSVTAGTPLAAGASVNVAFLLGIQTTGANRFCVVAETVPPSATQVACYLSERPAPAACGAPVFVEKFDGATAPALPAGWTAVIAAGPGPGWVTSSTSPASAPLAAFVDEPNVVSDKRLETPGIFIASAAAQLTFSNSYNFEFSVLDFYDGGVLEVSSPNINGGTFTDITDAAVGGSFATGGYNATISTNFSNPIAGRPAWSANSGGYLNTVANLGPNVGGHTIKLRFRMGSDNSNVGGGWRIDNVSVTDGGCSKALNISTRMQVQTGNNVLIAGFIVSGTAPKEVVIRGLGPSLAGFGIPGVMSDPVVELHASNGTALLRNDDWATGPSVSRLSTLGLVPTDGHESALVTTLAPGSYTAILSGYQDGTGVGLVEVYGIEAATNDAQMANISTRGFVQAGDNVMIGGFILGGNGSTNVAVRGIGPSLSAFGINPALADPTLELRDGNGALLVANDNWRDDPTTATNLSAHGLGLGDNHEAGIFRALPPGPFTAILAGKNGGTGVGLVEIYNVR
jgi:hypothetical protein